MEDNLKWKKTSIERWLPLEGDLHYKICSMGRLLTLKVDLFWKTTSIGNLLLLPPLKDNLHSELRKVLRRSTSISNIIVSSWAILRQYTHIYDKITDEYIDNMNILIL